jgi:hypothetical protein
MSNLKQKVLAPVLGGVSVYLLPLIAGAQATNVDTFLGNVTNWVSLLVGILITLAIVVFFWGLIKYLTAVGEEKHNGLMIMFYGVLTIFVMVALWGLVRFFGSALGNNLLDQSAQTVQLPNVSP